MCVFSQPKKESAPPPVAPPPLAPMQSPEAVQRNDTSATNRRPSAARSNLRIDLNAGGQAQSGLNIPA